jgi:hypothetical protein
MQDGNKLAEHGGSPPEHTKPGIKGHVAIQSPELVSRLEAIESKLQKQDGRSAMSWILDVCKTLLPSIVLAVLGFALKDSVDQALRQREIQLAAVKEMESLVPDLQKTDLDQVNAEAKAAQLAAYGRYAVPFFVNILEVGNQYAQAGAKDGLRMVARSEPDQVCMTLRSVIQNRTGLYQWQTHLAALKILGQAGCKESCREVVKYRDTMLNTGNYEAWVSSPPIQTEFDKVSKQASDTVSQLSILAPGECK